MEPGSPTTSRATSLTILNTSLNKITGSVGGARRLPIRALCAARIFLGHPHVGHLKSIALVFFVVLFIAVMVRNASRTGGVYPRSFVLTSATNGTAYFHGVSLANPHLRRTVFRSLSMLGAEVDLVPARGSMRNPVARSNLWSTAADISRLGLGPADKVVARQNRLFLLAVEAIKTNPFVLGRVGSPVAPILHNVGPSSAVLGLDGHYHGFYSIAAKGSNGQELLKVYRSEE